MNRNDTVAISKCNSYAESDIRKSLLEVIDATRFPDVSGKKVLLKPNILSDAAPSDCITTNPQVIRQMIRICFEKGATEIHVGDSPGMQGNDFKPVKSEIWQICQDEGAIWEDFTANPVTKDIKNVNIKLPVAAVFDKVDVIIGLCKMKNHQLMYKTGAVKNFFGSVPSIHKSQCHLKFQSRENFAKLIVGLHETVKPDYSVMDAVIGMEGPGPANGSPRVIGLLIGSDNDFATDYTEALIMGYNPEDIPIVAEAKQQKLFSPQINYPLAKPEEVTVKDFVKIPYRKRTQFFKKLVLPFITRKHEQKKRHKEPVPCFSAEKCIHCLRCVNICPAKALTFDKEQKLIKADYTKCIRCYCCHEMCPADAIEVKRK